MNLQIEIKQAEASVAGLEIMVSVRRASLDELQRAKERLENLKKQLTPPQVISTQKEVIDDRPIYYQPVTVSAEMQEVLADLHKKIRRQQDQMAELSNQLHLVPDNEPASDLVPAILRHKIEIEGFWDMVHYIERNNAIPEEPEQNTREAIELSGLQKHELMELRKKLTEKASKLRRKLSDPKAKDSKKVEWESQLIQAEMELKEIKILF